MPTTYQEVTRPSSGKIETSLCDGLPSNAALVIVDLQKAFDDPRTGRRNNPEAETNTRRRGLAGRFIHPLALAAFLTRPQSKPQIGA